MTKPEFAFKLGDIVRHRADRDSPRMLVTELQACWKDGDDLPRLWYLCEWVSEGGHNARCFSEFDIEPAPTGGINGFVQP